MLRITIETSNAALDVATSGSGAYYEMARILREIAARLEDEQGADGALVHVRDINGNTVGSYQLT